MEPYKLSPKELRTLNQGLSDCEAIKADLERARIAGVPNIEHIEEAVAKCEEKINALKSTYASNKK
jgi:hypothetical protein